MANFYLFQRPGRGYEAAKSPLVKRLLAEGHAVQRQQDGSITIGAHRFVPKRMLKRG